MEEPASTKTPKETTASLDTSPKNSAKGLKLALVACALLAVGGLGFGVYEVLQNGNQAVKISELSAKLDLVKMETHTELVDKEEDGVIRTYVEPAAETNSAEGTKTEGYIYIGEWGIKIKIPDTIKSVTYATSKYGAYIGARSINDASENVDFRDDFSNLLYNPYGVGAFSVIDNPDKCAMGEIDVEGDPGSGIRCKIVVKNSAGKEIGIRYEHPQAVYATSEDQKKLEVEAVGLVEKWLQDVSVYSAI